MKTNEFAYWLQGYFELRESEGPLTLKQIDTIQKHIDLVKARLEETKAKPKSELYKRVELFLKIFKTPKLGIDHGELTAVLCDDVAVEFQHVIDPSYTKTPEQKKKYNTAHEGDSGGYSGGKDISYRC